MAVFPFWQLEGLLELFEYWAASQHPSDELREIVVQWIFTRYNDPYEGVRREPMNPNLWYGQIPRTVRNDSVVVCGYSIFATSRSSELAVRTRFVGGP